MADSDITTRILLQPLHVPGIYVAAPGTGAVIDTASFEGVVFQAHVGTITTGNWVATVEQADDESFTVNVESVPADQLVGSLPTLTSVNDETIYRVGVLNRRRFVRLNIAGTGAGLFSASAILGAAHHEPTVTV